DQIKELEAKQSYVINLSGEDYTLLLEEVEILTEDIEGWLVASEKGRTVALDISLTEDLRNEGYARELVNRVQNLRKQRDYEVTDRIQIKLEDNLVIKTAVDSFKDYICNETLADDIEFHNDIKDSEEIELNDQTILINILKS
ncbi:MAG TPA: DUF5915 domain-containing protein, partial [Chitinophagales bacterium]|nr:DUF5915 domain-containing protein [Chitinophagales bacterium]